MSILRFEYSNDKQLITQIADEDNTFLWVAFAQNSEGNCIIEKEFAFNPSQTFFTLERAVDNINNFAIDDTNLYVAYDDTTLFGEIINSTNPLTNTTTISIPSGIVESPIDVLINGSDLWYLLPGNLTGENAKLLRFNTSGSLQETVDLTKSDLTVVDAEKFTIEPISGDLWIGTNTDPGTIVRVFALSGGGYDFTETQFI